MVTIEGPQLPVTPSDGVVVVRPGESIAAAIAEAAAGTDVIVEPGEYRERLILRNGIRVVSRVPRAATIRLPGGASESEAAVVAIGSMTAELSGFRIVGDAATPLGTGIVVRDAAVSIVNCEISGAARTALDLGGGHAVVIGSDIHDNPGTALEIRSGGAAARDAQRVFPQRSGLPRRLVGHRRTRRESRGLRQHLRRRRAAHGSRRRGPRSDPAEQLVRGEPAAGIPHRHQRTRSMNTGIFNRIGPYDIDREIGRGGMAVVFLARDTRTNTDVALKQVPVGTDREAPGDLRSRAMGCEAAGAVLHREPARAEGLRTLHDRRSLLRRDGVRRWRKSF